MSKTSGTNLCDSDEGLDGDSEAGLGAPDHGPASTHTDDGSYYVTWTFQMAMSVPRSSSGTGRRRILKRRRSSI